MSILALCQSLQDTWLSTTLRESTWGYPVIAAVHVLGIAWFGGIVLIADLGLLDSSDAQQLRRWKPAAVIFMLVSGGAVFALQPVRYYESVLFRTKLLLLLPAILNTLTLPPVPSGLRRRISPALWAGVIIAARGTAYL